MAGAVTTTNQTAPGNPISGRSEIYTDSTSKNLAQKNDAGTVNHGVQTVAAVTGSYVGSITDAGVAGLVALGKSDFDQISIHGGDIASGGTINLETATGYLVDVTGTTTITAITLNEGHQRVVRFTGILTLTNGASLVLPGNANIATVAGDYATFVGYAAGVVRCCDYTKFNSTGTGSAVFATTPTLVTPNIGAATGTSVILTGAHTSSSPTAGIGYATGAGGAITQLTSKVTAFTLNTVCGTIQFAADALAADTTSAGATWTNSAIAATDLVVFTHSSGGTFGAYNVTCTSAGGSANIKIRNLTPGSLSEAPVFRFTVFKGVVA